MFQPGCVCPGCARMSPDDYAAGAQVSLQLGGHITATTVVTDALIAHIGAQAPIDDLIHKSIQVTLFALCAGLDVRQRTFDLHVQFATHRTPGDSLDLLDVLRMALDAEARLLTKLREMLRRAGVAFDEPGPAPQFQADTIPTTAH